MYLGIVLWLAMNGDGRDKFPHLPVESDAFRFPSVDACREQKKRWEDHAEWLERSAPAWPERRETFAAWKARADHGAFLWGVLAEAVAREDWMGEEELRSRLRRYRYWVGDANYRAGYTPMALPADLHPELPERLSPEPRPAGGNGR
jgi:hypothetical protein